MASSSLSVSVRESLGAESAGRDSLVLESRLGSESASRVSFTDFRLAIITGVARARVNLLLPSTSSLAKGLLQHCQEEKKMSKGNEASTKQIVINVEKSNGKLSMVKESNIEESQGPKNEWEKESVSKCRSQEAQDDVLEIGNSETFDDLDFEPEDNQSGETVLFKSMTSKFSIPKVATIGR